MATLEALAGQSDRRVRGIGQPKPERKRAAQGTAAVSFEAWMRGRTCAQREASAEADALLGIERGRRRGRKRASAPSQDLADAYRAAVVGVSVGSRRKGSAAVDIGGTWV